MEELARFLKKNDDADEMKNIAETMAKRVNDHAWDGEWYIYAINKEGSRVELSRGGRMISMLSVIFYFPEVFYNCILDNLCLKYGHTYMNKIFSRLGFITWR